MILLKKIKALFRGIFLILRAGGRTIITQIRWPSSKIGFNSAVTKSCVLAGENSIGQSCVIANSKFGVASYCAHNVVIVNSDIGAYTSIGSNVSIGLFQHPTRGYISTFPGFHIAWRETPYLDAPRPFKVNNETIVGNDVWIGDSARIVSGVKIGDGAIIGAGAVVIKDVPPYAVVGGIPAKIIRYRFTDKQIELLLKEKWWDWPRARIVKYQSLIADEKGFFDHFQKVNKL